MTYSLSFFYHEHSLQGQKAWLVTAIKENQSTPHRVLLTEFPLSNAASDSDFA